MSEHDTHHHTVDDDWPVFFPQYRENHVLEAYVGSYIKLRFAGKDWKGEARTEDLWVEVTGVMGQELIGNVDNVPSLKMEYSCGDPVCFELHEIKRIIKPGAPVSEWSSWKLSAN